MRIGVNCYPLQAHVGGLRQYFLALFDELLECDNLECVLFCFPQNEEVLAELQNDRWRRSAIKLEDQLDVSGHLDAFDVYFCPFAALYPRPVPKPSVVMLPDVQEVFYPRFFTEFDLYMRELHFGRSTRVAEGVVTISEFSKQTIVAHHRVPSAKVSVAYPSIDRRYQVAAQVERAPKQPVPRDFVFYPANLWKHKNHDGLLRALRHLRFQRRLVVNAVLTGFPQKNGYSLLEKAREYGVADQVHFLTYLSVEELAYLYRRARMLVFPSLFEGFGLPLVEAMTCGCPAVAARATSIPEVLAGAGELFEPDSAESLATAIERLWHSPALRSERAVAGRLRAEWFTPARSAAAHISAFEAAMKRFSYARFLLNQWLFEKVHRARVASRWRSCAFR